MRNLPEVTIREVPYPYKAMLAICSDLDGTRNIDAYLAVARFLNTTEMTAMGPGVGLEVGNSIYFDMRPGQFSYWNTSDAGREMIRFLIQSGHIDCLHSYGDLATTRFHAGKALDELSKYYCHVDVWVDHAVAPSNFGQDIMKGSGDVPGSTVYHADLTCGFGIRYVWRGRVTSVIGQECPRSFKGIFHPSHPFISVRTMAKEFLKMVLSGAGSTKYAMHRGNKLIREVNLRDGTRVTEFIRCNPHWRGVSIGDTADGLSEVLTERFLNDLANRGGLCILYTHLGKALDPERPLGPKTVKALRLLSRYRDEGKVLVTTTSRLLNYITNIHALKLDAVRRDDVILVTISSDRGLPDLKGVSLEVPQGLMTRVFVNGQDVAGFIESESDHMGRRIITFPRSKIEFPAI